jgi:hypothetical protein
MYIFEQLFSHHGYEYAIAVLAMFVFIWLYFILSQERKY